jgi:hypothetical protein
MAPPDPKIGGDAAGQGGAIARNGLVVKQETIGNMSITFRLVKKDTGEEVGAISTKAADPKLGYPKNAQVIIYSEITGSLRGKGIGPEFYKIANSYLKIRGRRLASDWERSDSAESVWRKLQATTGKVKDFELPTGEPVFMFETNAINEAYQSEQELKQAGVTVEPEDRGNDLEFHLLDKEQKEIGNVYLRPLPDDTDFFFVALSEIDAEWKGKGVGRASYRWINSWLKQHKGKKLASGDPRSVPAEWLWKRLAGQGKAKASEPGPFPERYYFTEALEMIEKAEDFGTTDVLYHATEGTEALTQILKTNKLGFSRHEDQQDDEKVISFTRNPDFWYNESADQLVIDAKKLRQDYTVEHYDLRDDGQDAYFGDEEEERVVDGPIRDIKKYIKKIEMRRSSDTAEQPEIAELLAVAKRLNISVEFVDRRINHKHEMTSFEEALSIIESVDDDEYHPAFGVESVIRSSKDIFAKHGIDVDRMKRIGEGQIGAAYSIDGKVIKLTPDRRETAAAKKLLGKTFKHLTRIFDVFELPGEKKFFVVVQEQLQPLDRSDVSELEEMYSVITDETGDGRDIGWQIAGKSWPEVVPIVKKKIEDDHAIDWDSDYAQDLMKPDRDFITIERFMEIAEKFQLPEIFTDLKRAGIKHSDINPGNFMKRSNGDIVAIDVMEHDRQVESLDEAPKNRLDLIKSRDAELDRMDKQHPDVRVNRAYSGGEAKDLERIIKSILSKAGDRGLSEEEIIEKLVIEWNGKISPEPDGRYLTRTPEFRRAVRGVKLKLKELQTGGYFDLREFLRSIAKNDTDDLIGKKWSMRSPGAGQWVLTSESHSILETPFSSKDDVLDHHLSDVPWKKLTAYNAPPNLIDEAELSSFVGFVKEIEYQPETDDQYGSFELHLMCVDLEEFEESGLAGPRFRNKKGYLVDLEFFFKSDGATDSENLFHHEKTFPDRDSALRHVEDVKRFVDQRSLRQLMSIRKRGPIGLSRLESRLHEAEKSEGDLGFGFNEDGYPLEDRLELFGFDIPIENKKGSVRRWHDENGNETGATEMKSHYGYIEGTEGADGDPVDVYVGDDEESAWAFVVHQLKLPDFEEYDEDKVMLGFPDEASAKEAYLAQYDRPEFYGGMSAMPLDRFRDKVAKGGKVTNERRSAFSRALVMIEGVICESSPIELERDFGLPPEVAQMFQKLFGSLARSMAAAFVAHTRDVEGEQIHDLDVKRVESFLETFLGGAEDADDLRDNIDTEGGIVYRAFLHDTAFASSVKDPDEDWDVLFKAAKSVTPTEPGRYEDEPMRDDESRSMKRESAWDKIREGTIARTTDVSLSSNRIDKVGGLDREFQEIGHTLDQSVEKLNQTRARSKEYDRTPPVDDKKVATFWKKLLDVLAGVGA